MNLEEGHIQFVSTRTLSHQNYAIWDYEHYYEIEIDHDQSTPLTDSIVDPKTELLWYELQILGLLL